MRSLTISRDSAARPPCGEQGKLDVLEVADISALDILGSMQRDQEWLTKMNVCGQTEPVFEALSAARGDDEIMDTACLLFLYIVQHSGISMEQVLVEHPTAVMQVIGKGLGMSSGPLDKAYPAKVNAIVSFRCHCLCKLTMRSRNSARWDGTWRRSTRMKGPRRDTSLHRSCRTSCRTLTGGQVCSLRSRRRPSA